MALTSKTVFKAEKLCILKRGQLYLHFGGPVYLSMVMGLKVR